jgi:3'(2'), 5'-bisphosphate nucleotidase
MNHIPDILPHVIAAARAAGERIMEHYKGDNVVYEKQDASPVTDADHQANEMIVSALKKITPHILIVSEEGHKPDVSGAEYFWLVDPLDGTKSFIKGRGYFTVNIGLIQNCSNPVFGVIYDPAGKVMYYGSSQGAFREQDGVSTRIHARKAPNPATAFISHSHINKPTEDYLLSKNIGERIPCASSIKFCFLAEGKGDIYPRFGPTMEWDTAAGHAILKAAGGDITLPGGETFLYGKANFLNGNFIAFGSHPTV